LASFGFGEHLDVRLSLEVDQYLEVAS